MSPSPNPYLEGRRAPRIPARRIVYACLVAVVATACAVLALRREGGASVEACLTARGAHVALAAPGVELTETVTVSVAGAGEGAGEVADVEVELVDAATGEAVTSARRRAGTDAAIDVPLPLDASRLAGRTVVAHVRVLRDGKVAFESRDDTCADQTVRFPSVTVSAPRPREGDREVTAHVSYENLEPGESFELACALRDRLLGTVPDGASTTLTIVPDTSRGTAEATIPVGAATLEGRDMRLEAELRCAGRTVASLTGSDAPAVGLPAIEAATDATVERTGDALAVTRTITYAGLEPGRTYTVVSTADVPTGDGRQEAPAAQRTDFVALEGQGEVSVTQPLDAAAARTEIAFADTLVDAGGQAVAGASGHSVSTVKVPAMSTATVGAHTGIACEPATGDALLRGVASCSGLVPGATYDVSGTLEVVGEDGDGLTLVGEDGMPVCTTTTLVAGADGTGSAELAYALDASGLAGKCVRATERLSRDGVAVATATGDAVRIPSIGVTATDAATHTHECDAGAGEATVEIEVSLANLPDGDDLELSVTLLDAATGAAVVGADGGEATARTAVPGGTHPTTARLTVGLDAEQLVGAPVVAVARVESGGRTVASTGGDWDDAARVSVPRVFATLADAETGSRTATIGTDAPLVACVEATGLERDAAHAVTLELVDAETGDLVTDASGTPVRSVVALEAEGTSASAKAELAPDTTTCRGRTLALRATLSQGDAVTGTSDTATPESRVGVASATVTRGTDRRGEPVATVSWSGLEPGEGYVARVRDAATGGPAIELPLEVASQEGTAQLQIAGLMAPEESTHPEFVVEVLRDGRVVALADGQDDAAAGNAAGNAGRASARPATGANLRRTVPVAADGGRGLLPRVARSVGLTVAIAAAGALALRGMWGRERASAEA